MRQIVFNPNHMNDIKMLRWTGTMIALLVFIFSSTQTVACDSCALFDGVTPNANRNRAGLHFRYRSFRNWNGTLPSGTGTNKTQHLTDGLVPEAGSAAANGSEFFTTTRAYARWFFAKRWFTQLEVPIVVNGIRDGNSYTFSGLADISCLVGFELLNKQYEKHAFQVFLVGGVKLPIGMRESSQTSYVDNFELQGTTGSTDVLGRIQASWRTGKLGIQSTLSYRINNRNGLDMRYGNFLNANLNGFYLIDWDTRILRVMPYAGAFLESFTGLYSGESRTYGIGGTILSASIGASFFWDRISIQPEVQLPVVQHLNDLQLKAQPVLSVDLSYYF